MAVTYKKLFHLLIDKRMTNAELMEQAGFTFTVIPSNAEEIVSPATPDRLVEELAFLKANEVQPNE